jgi:hypothetical protein
MDVLITSDSAKLPAEVLQIQDVDRPLPPDVQFFEEKITYSDLATQLIWGIVLMPLGALVLILAVFMMFAIDRHTASYSSSLDFLFVVAAVGFVFLGAGYLLLKSLWPKFQCMKRQQRGVATRFGIFLVAEMLVSHSVFDTTIVPKPYFKGLKGRSVQYERNGETKSFDLPATLVGKDVQNLDTAIANWAA